MWMRGRWSATSWTYLTALDGATGRELQTVRYEPGRHDDGLMRGDYALPRIEPGNRVDRFLAGVAYRWDGRRLARDWFVDSGWVPVGNPFDDAVHNRNGTSASHGALATQGAHSLSAADVDGDGRQEVVHGAATVDDGGTLRHSSFGVLPPGSARPGEVERLGHGMVGDVLPDVPGLETWASAPGGTGAVGLWSADGRRLSEAIPGTNQGIRWAADLTTQVVDGSGEAEPVVRDWRRGVLLTATGARADNGTKGNPSLVADVLGDWREELVVRTVDSSALRFCASTEVTGHKMYSLMQDPQYRVEVARQQTAYNQPSHPGFHLASDTDWSTVPR
ncbi:rhamnogalacturonan lyase family protein [Saccharothrix syringae]|uniref:Rhamnogalacturonan lyase family 11 C-terminal domain-containing protein n=1 Tax=Saccharothrix syringae TaxID=103733 RepID=A0A5Q0H1K6_SACSY|nr:hypothetical protein [Saccharothrix syringae]QFZ20136.1 hypothetical protein EKG83_24380 [Saccharothrix syringae]